MIIVECSNFNETSQRRSSSSGSAPSTCFRVGAMRPRQDGSRPVTRGRAMSRPDPRAQPGQGRGDRVSERRRKC